MNNFQSDLTNVLAKSNTLITISKFIATWLPVHSTVVEEQCSQVAFESLCSHNATVVNIRLVQMLSAFVCLTGAIQSYVVLSMIPSSSSVPAVVIPVY